MKREDELWILLTDPHEINEVDGAWAEAIARLSGCDSPGPLVVTEPRIAECAKTVAPRATIHVSDPDGPVRRLENLDNDRAALLDLLFLRGAIPSHDRISHIRSFGLRSSILGCAIASQIDRTHTAFLVARPEEDLLPLRGFRRRRAIRYLEGWVIASSDSVETPDSASASHFAEVFLPPAGKVAPMTASTVDRSETAAQNGSASVGVLAASQRWGKNRILIEALASRRLDSRFRLHWLARRQGFASMRARQDLRSSNLVEHLHWEEEPWTHPIRTRETLWDLLLIPAPSTCVQTLAAHFSANGGTVVVPEDSGQIAPLPGLVRTPWTAPHLVEVLETHGIGASKSVTATARKGGE